MIATASRKSRAHGGGARPFGRWLLACGITAVAVFVAAAAPRAACLGGGTSSLPVPTVEFLRSYRAAFATPTRLAVDSSANVYVADPARGTVTVRTPDGRVLSRVTGLESPVSIGASHVGVFFVGNGTDGSVAIVSIL